MAIDDNIKAIDSIIANSKSNVKFAKKYISKGSADFDKAPEEIKRSHSNIIAVMGSFGIAHAAAFTAMPMLAGMAPILGATAFTPLAPFIIGGAVGLSLIVKRHLKERRNDIEKCDAEVSKYLNILQEKYGVNVSKINSSIEEYNSVIGSVINDYLEKAKETKRKLQIELSDLVHKDVNKRILEYQEIVLKQYERQNELDKKLYDVACKYKKVMEENEKLTEENKELMSIIQALSKNNAELKQLIK